VGVGVGYPHYAYGYYAPGYYAPGYYARWHHPVQVYPYRYGHRGRW